MLSKGRYFTVEDPVTEIPRRLARYERKKTPWNPKVQEASLCLCRPSAVECVIPAGWASLNLLMKEFLILPNTFILSVIYNITTTFYP